MDIEIIINDLEYKYYTNINTTLSKNNVEINWIITHINKLKELVNTDTESNIIKKNEIIVVNTPDDNNNLYKKSWSKLNAIHKIIKVKEFVNNIIFDNETEREILKDELVNLIKIKVLTKKDKIMYDEENGKIISLKHLQYKDGKYFYLQE